MSTTGSSTLPITADTALAAIALQSDAHAAILAGHGVDFCRAGRRSLLQVCASSGLDPDALIAELDAAARARAAEAATARNWNECPLGELVDFIAGTHHAFTRGAISRIAPLLTKVIIKHGERHAELAKITEVFTDIAADIGPHMMREERLLFPYIRALALAGPARPLTPPFGSVRNPVRAMMAEHDRETGLLGRLRELTGDFAAPADACISYRVLYAALAELYRDLLQHMSLENEVLFPRALALQENIRDRAHDQAAVR